LVRTLRLAALAGGATAKLVLVGRAGKIAAGVAGTIALGLGLAQVFLPRIATDRISTRLSRYGTVKSVSVEAWPAVELLWGRADSVKATMGSLKVSPTQTASLLREGRGAKALEVTASTAEEGPLRLSDVSLRKRGDALTAEAFISQADVTAALPQGFEVQLLRSEGGEVAVRASGGLFGVGAAVSAVAQPSEGRLVAHPVGPLLEGLKVTLFADPHIYVEAVGASQAAGRGGEPGYRLTLSARAR
jgi:hypothetical protein